MKSDEATIILQKDDVKYKLMKIIFDNNGSYYITAPYHNQKKAFLFKSKVNYQKTNQFVPIDEVMECSMLDDDKLTLKISHHPDGFLQFSGAGIKSGKNIDGTPKGIGIQSWPLDSPPGGPAFGVTIKNYKNMITSTGPDVDELCIKLETVPKNTDFTSIIIEGYFIPQKYEQFIYVVNGIEGISPIHPTEKILKLRVVRPAKVRKYFGFIGLDIKVASPSVTCGDFEYIFSTSTGKITANGNDLLTGVGLYAVYPNISNLDLPSLNWPPK